jgi:uncharacterized protein YjbI with pentapeptide repeats
MPEKPQKINRSITIQESAVGNAIVSGDGNKIYVIHQTFVQQSTSIQKSDEKVGLNPYKGLASFKEQDADRYFGREAQVQRLLSRLQKLLGPTITPRVLPILGPSGCGKSSLARAGLIPELAKRPLPGKEEAKVAVLLPGNNPVKSLASVLAKIVTNDPLPVAKAVEFERILKEKNDAGEFDGIRQILSLISDAQNYPLFIFVDQFEEIYSLCKNADLRRIFIDTLLDAASDSNGVVSLIFALRSDFLHKTQSHEVLNSLVGSDQSVIVPAMKPFELRRAIVEPAKRAGCSLDEAVVDLLVKDTQGREGALPLLQFALSRIWEGIRQGQNPSDLYWEMGGVGGALAGKAEEIYEVLDDVEKDISKRVFVGLIELGEGTGNTRQRVSIEGLMSKKDNPAKFKRVIDEFASPSARLITVSSTSRESQIIEATHESLFENWNRIESWLDESRDFIRIKRRTETATLEWLELGKPRGYLLQGRQLSDASIFLKEHSKNLPFSERAESFIKASMRQRLRNRFLLSCLGLIPLIAVEIYLREFTIRGDYVKLNQYSRGNASFLEFQQSLENLSEGCGRIYDWPEMLFYIGERIHGNCRSLAYINFSGLDLSEIRITNVDCLGCGFRGSILRDTSFAGVNLQESNLIDADLSSSDFIRASFKDANLLGANLERSDFIGSSFIRANLSQANMKNSAFARALFMSADLSNANLESSNFENADLSYSSLDNSNLNGTNLSGATLEFADLSGASLEDANLAQANLVNVLSLSEQQIMKSRLCQTLLPDGFSLDPNRDCTDQQTYNFGADSVELDASDWVEVATTGDGDPISPGSSYVDVKGIRRDGSLVIFDFVNGFDSGYGRAEVNCESKTYRPLRVGYFVSENIARFDNYREQLDTPNEYQRKLLDFVCEITS